jgi:hypothetical protein
VAEDVLSLERRSLARVFPALRLLAAIRLAFDLRKLMLAAGGLVLLQAGWFWLDWLFPASAAATPELADFTAPTGVELQGLAGTWEELSRLPTRIVEPERLLAAPLLAALEPGCSWAQMTHALLAVLWLILIWAICGGMIARMAVLQLGGTPSAGLTRAWRFLVRAAPSLIVAPLCPLLALGSCALFVAAFGLLYHIPWAGPVLAGLLLVLPLAAGLVMTLLAATLVAGWPLLQAAVASGAEDALEALSRTFSYITQRIGPFTALLLLAGLLGMIGLLFMDLLAASVIRLTHWGLGISVPEVSLATLFGGTGTQPAFLAVVFHAFWLGVVRLIAHAWTYSFFWTAASLLYLWLRQDVDGTPWDDLGPLDEAPELAIDGGALAGARPVAIPEPESTSLP